MNARMRALTLAVQATVMLLVTSGVLMVLGIFNAALRWDLFGPKVEAALYGVFGSCLALAAVGLGLTIVLGTQEVVVAFRALRRPSDAEKAAAAELDRLNAETGFTFYRLVRNDAGKPIAVLRVDGPPRESFRGYPLGK